MEDTARRMFADIDAMRMDEFLSYLDPDATFRFGNAPEIRGHDAVREAIAGFWASIADLTHHMHDVWSVGDDVTVCRMDVEYVRKDGHHVTVPNVDVLSWKDGKIVDFKAYIDLAPVFAPVVA